MGEPALIIVTGTPGTGKSAISRLLAEELGCAHVESSALLVEGKATARDPTGRDTMIIVEDKAREVIRGFIESSRGACYIVSTLHPSLWLETLGENVALVILLRSDPRILMERLSERGWSRAKILENVLSEAFNTVAEELLEWSDCVVEVDTSYREPRLVLDEVFEKLEAWSVGIGIDWMSVNPEIVEFVTRLVHELDLYKEGLGV